MTKTDFRDAVLFVAHAGTFGSIDSPVCGIVIEGHALPIATKRPSTDDDGFAACWGAEIDVEHFFADIDIDHVEAPGLWVAETRYRDKDVEVNDFEHLSYGQLIRRPLPEEVARMADGLPPWEGGCWL